MENRDFGILFKHIHDALYKQSNNRLRGSALTLTQLGLLLSLERLPEQTASIKTLEKILQVAQPTVVGVVARLQQKQFVRTEEDARDRRVKQVHLTEAGRAKCREAEAFMDRDQDWLLQGFTEQEKQQFYQYLKRVEQNVQK